MGCPAYRFYAQICINISNSETVISANHANLKSTLCCNKCILVTSETAGKLPNHEYHGFLTKPRTGKGLITLNSNPGCHTS